MAPARVAIQFSAHRRTLPPIGYTAGNEVGHDHRRSAARLGGNGVRVRRRRDLRCLHRSSLYGIWTAVGPHDAPHYGGRCAGLDGPLPSRAQAPRLIRRAGSVVVADVDSAIGKQGADGREGAREVEGKARFNGGR